MNGINVNNMQFSNQNDYPCHLRQIDIFEEQYKTGLSQSYWYVIGICQKKDNCGIQFGKYWFWYLIDM